MRDAARVCEHCGTTNPAGARFCRRCGTGGPAPAFVSTTQVTPVMQLWRRLTRQLTRREVRALLGEPAQVDPGPAGGDLEIWLYEYAAAGEPPARVAGTVSFSIGGGHVVTWVEPEWRGVPNGE